MKNFPFEKIEGNNVITGSSALHQLRDYVTSARQVTVGNAITGASTGTALRHPAKLSQTRSRLPTGGFDTLLGLRGATCFSFGLYTAERSFKLFASLSCVLYS